MAKRVRAALRAFSMRGETGGNMRVLSEEKIKVLAEKTAGRWLTLKAISMVKPFADADMTPSKYAQVGIDEYCLGFRAVYYECKNPSLTRSDMPDRVPRNAGRSLKSWGVERCLTERRIA